MSQDIPKGKVTTKLPAPTLNVISSGNPQFDQILGGGIPRGSLLMLVGAPGTGKTTLALQLCFKWQRQATDATNQEANRSVYFSLLSESHDKLIAHAGQFNFFEAEQLNKTVKFYSLSSQLDKTYKEVLNFIFKTIRQEKAGLVVIDGFTALAEIFANRSITRQFLFTLSSQLTILGITGLISIERPADSGVLSAGDLTVADGVVSLTSRLDGAGEYFAMQVIKLRGTKRLLGLHSYAITEEGIEVFPRLEALVKNELTLKGKGLTQTVPSRNLQQNWNRSLPGSLSSEPNAAEAGKEPRKTFGLPELERMLGGGLPARSSTLIAGSVGVGKTLLGVHFLVQGVQLGERGLYLGFYEGNTALYRKARDFGMDLKSAHATGMVDLLITPSFEIEPDQVMQQVRQLIEDKGISRLVVDGFSELELACRSTSRSHNFASAFELYLKQHNVTVIYTHSISKLVGSELDLSDTPFSSVAENLLLMRQGEFKNHLYRIISVLKMRDSNYDRTIREFSISDGGGIKVLEESQSLPGLLEDLTEKLENDTGKGITPGARK